MVTLKRVVPESRGTCTAVFYCLLLHHCTPQKPGLKENQVLSLQLSFIIFITFSEEFKTGKGYKNSEGVQRRASSWATRQQSGTVERQICLHTHQLSEAADQPNNRKLLPASSDSLHAHPWLTEEHSCADTCHGYVPGLATFSRNLRPL